MLLGDYGADVVKIEDLQGDATRRFWPEKTKGMSYWHLMLNRNKRGVALNLKKDGGRDLLLKLLREKGVDLADHPALQVREYIYDMAAVMRAADLVLCRAGASTISELTALGVPAVIVPSPYVTNNHQEKNARVLENAGGAAVLLEKDCSGQALFQAACGILHDGARRASMERAMSALGIRDATERIYQTVLEICQ